MIAAVHDVDSSMKKGATVEFFDSCRRTLQLHIADKLDVAADTVTLNEVEKVYGEEATKIIELFDMADAVKYSGQSIDQAEMKQWRTLLDTQLKKLGGSL